MFESGLVSFEMYTAGSRRRKVLRTLASRLFSAPAESHAAHMVVERRSLESWGSSSCFIKVSSAIDIFQIEFLQPDKQVLTHCSFSESSVSNGWSKSISSVNTLHKFSTELYSRLPICGLPLLRLSR